MNKYLIASLLIATPFIATMASAEIVELKYSGTITDTWDGRKVERPFVLPDGASDENALIGSRVSGHILVDTEKLPSDKYKNHENKVYYLGGNTSYLSMSLVIEDTNETFALNSLDAINTGDSQVRLEQKLDYKNDNGQYDDSLQIRKKNTFIRYEGGVQVVYNYVELTLSIGNQQFTNSADITDPLNAYVAANSKKGKLMISENIDRGSPEKSGNLYFQIDHIYKVEECN